MGMFSDPADRYRFEPELIGNERCDFINCDEHGEYETADGNYICLSCHEHLIEEAEARAEAAKEQDND